MKRRQFLKLSAAAAAGCALPSCMHLTPRYAPREGLAPRAEPLLLTNANFVDVGRGALRPERAAYLRDGRIAELFPPQGDRALPSCRTLDLRGAYVIPGLINAHCHITMPGALAFSPKLIFAYERQIERNAEECVKHGVTTIRDMLAMDDALTALAAKISVGQVVGPRIRWCCALDVPRGYAAGMSIAPQERFAQTVNTPAAGRAAVARAADAGADFIKLFQQPKALLMPGAALPVMDLPTVAAVCDEAAKRGRIVALHHTGAAGFHKGLDGGAATMEHMVSDRLLTDEEIAAAKMRGAAFIPTASVAFSLAYRMAGDPNWGRGFLPQMVERRKAFMPELIREFAEPDLADSTLSYFHELSDPSSYQIKHLFPWPLPTVFTAAATNGAANALALYKAGAPMGCGNDGGVPLIFPGAMHLEMTLLEEVGFAPADVLRMATIDNARLLGLDAMLGSIEVKKIADLAVYEKNPLDPSPHVRRPFLVLQEGRVVYS
jgi:imidazolonepropionase-like amidohydrolase